MSDRPLVRFRSLLSRAALVAGGACLVLGALAATVARSAFDPVVFGDRLAASLEDPRVAAFAADRITSAVLEQSPDLTAVRPLLLATAEGLASTQPFRALARAAARSAHRTLFAEGTRQIVLSVPDVGVLLRSGFERASPELAERIPKRLRAAAVSLETGEGLRVVLDLWGLREHVEGIAWLLFALAPGLLGLGAGLAEDRRRGLVGAGLSLLVSGVLVAAALPAGSRFVSGLAQEPLEARALEGIWHAFMAGLGAWGLMLGGLGVLFAAAGTSLLEVRVPLDWARRAARAVARPPASRAGRLGWGLALLAAGGVAVSAPLVVLQAIVVAAGTAAAFLGVRELFRLVLDSVEAGPAALPAAPRRSWLGPVLALGLAGLVGGLWIVGRNPTGASAPTSVEDCNGYAALCDRRLDQVVFAGAHNAMSNVEIPDWMFPHHEAGIPRQLADGVRALLVDVHYGFPGASRIKTDLGGDRPSTQALEHAVGEEGVAAALRIRERLVGVDEGRRTLYLCHGFCELGAYELAPALARIREFLIQNPGEVLLIVVEDYVAPDDLAEAFEASGLAERVYRGPPGPPWPTLWQLVASGQQVVVFLESGRAGVAWLLPAFELIQETPYTFRSPDQFSCRPNRGSPEASLFQLNHWIETTPAPLPSNARVVNARDALLRRARLCERERGRLPNVVAVDFYRSGDLVGVVDELNGVGGRR